MLRSAVGATADAIADAFLTVPSSGVLVHTRMRMGLDVHTGTRTLSGLQGGTEVTLSKYLMGIVALGNTAWAAFKKEARVGVLEQACRVYDEQERK